jgi:hypothetical protein
VCWPTVQGNSVTDNVCKVCPYHPDYPFIDEVPIVQAATAYDNPEIQVTYIFVVNKALWIPDLRATLLIPNQFHANGIIMDYISKHLVPDPAIATHSIYVPNKDLRIHLDYTSIHT